MEDLVAVAAVLPSGERRYVVTWGRVQHTVDPAPLEALVLRHARRFAGCEEAVSAHVCHTLRDARDAPYFYEALIDFAARSRQGDDRDEWLRRTAERMESGRELYFLGDPARIPPPSWSEGDSDRNP